MREIHKRPQALRDIIEQADYLAQTSMNISDNFLRAVQDTLRTIATMPGVGFLRDFDRPEFKGMRVVLVTGFPKIGIYYLTTENTIDIVRVLHGARDIAGIFSAKNDEEETDSGGD